jgi:hypothetical protein
MKMIYNPNYVDSFDDKNPDIINVSNLISPEPQFIFVPDDYEEK